MYLVLPLRFSFYSRPNGHDASAVLTKDLEQAGVRKLAAYHRMNPFGIKPLFQRAAQYGVLCRQQERRPIQGQGEAAPIDSRDLWRSHEGQAALPEQMTERSNLGGGTDRSIRQDHVQGVHSKLRQQVVRLAMITNHLH